MTESKVERVPLPRELVGLVALALPLLVTVSTIEAADWVRGLPSLKALVLVSLLMWALVARSKLPWWAGHGLALLVGLAVAFVLGSLSLSDVSGPRDLARELAGWFGAIGSQGGDRGAALTGMFLIGLTLWMGHTTVWLAYRRDSPWMAALPGLGILLTVLTFLPSDYYWYFFMYLLAAAPGVAYRQNAGIIAAGGRAPLMGTLVAGLVVMGITLAPVWRAPAPEETVIPLASAFEKPWLSFREDWSDLFYGVPNRRVWPHFSPPRDLPFTGPIDPGEDLLYEVESREPYRWRTRVYDTYTNTGWESSEATLKTPLGEVPLLEYVGDLKDRKDVETTVRIYSKGNTLLSVGEPLGSSFPSEVELSPQPSFKLYLDGAQTGYLPPEVEANRNNIKRLLAPNGSGSPLQGRLPEFIRSLPEGDQRYLTFDFALQNFEYDLTPKLEDGSQVIPPSLTLERREPGPEPPVALLAERILVPPRQYRTLGSISDASPVDLREAPRDYPAWVTDRYLQLPHEFPDTVKELARDLTKDEDNPYDMAEAIRRHLLSLPYSLDVIQAPPGRDWVEFFLFEQRRGYCQNYASAMITMLRSLGIPARLVVGFAPGLWNEDREVWEVQTRHYHAWPEVYFPEYGWIEFEPTPSDVQPALGELGSPALIGVGDRATDPEACADFFFFEDCIQPFISQTAGDGDEDELFDPNAGTPDNSVASDGGLGFWSSPWLALSLAFSLAGVVMVGAVSLIRIRLSQVHEAAVTYASMCFLGRLAGLGMRPNDTPWEYSSRLARALPEHREPIVQVTGVFVHQRYGGPEKRNYGQEMWSLKAAWRSIRWALIGRILLRFLPNRRRDRLAP